MRDYIHVIPNEAAEAFHAMTGFERDWADTVREESEKLSKTKG